MLDYQPPGRRQTSTREGRRIRPERHNPSSIATLRIAIAHQLLWAVASLSLLRSHGDRLVFSVHIHFRDAGLWAGMVGRCVPHIFEQRYSAKFLQLDTTPV